MCIRDRLKTKSDQKLILQGQICLLQRSLSVSKTYGFAGAILLKQLSNIAILFLTDLELVFYELCLKAYMPLKNCNTTIGMKYSCNVMVGITCTTAKPKQSKLCFWKTIAANHDLMGFTMTCLCHRMHCQVCFLPQNTLSSMLFLIWKSAKLGGIKPMLKNLLQILYDFQGLLATKLT